MGITRRWSSTCVLSVTAAVLVLSGQGGVSAATGAATASGEMKASGAFRCSAGGASVLYKGNAVATAFGQVYRSPTAMFALYDCVGSPQAVGFFINKSPSATLFCAGLVSIHRVLGDRVFSGSGYCYPSDNERPRQRTSFSGVATSAQIAFVDS